MSQCAPHCGVPVCDPANEPLSSALNNFITQFFGTVGKTCVGNDVVWSLPCDLSQGSPNFPRLPGEGIACYLLRWFEAQSSNTGIVEGLKGFRSTTLTNTGLILFRFQDVINQDFTGTLSAAVTIYLTANGAQVGDSFYISFTNLVITNLLTFSLNSDGTNLVTLNSSGTVNGGYKVVWTGTIWKITLQSISIV